MSSRFDAIRRAIEAADPWLTEAGNAQLVVNLAAGIEAGLDWSEPRKPRCSCWYEKEFEGEILGDQYYLAMKDRRCPVHGKPRHEEGR